MALWIVFGVGLASSVHCLGMCGGFVIALAQLDRSARPMLRHGAYYIGKTATYAVLGALAGAAGAVISRLVGGVQDALSIVLGLVLVGLGLGLLGVIHTHHEPTIPGLARLSHLIGHLLREGSVPALFGLGMLNGLLPCALVYAMLVTAAASGSVARGALTMTVFGLATIPALVAVSYSSRLARPLWREHGNRIAGILVIVLGVLTILRGIPAIRGAVLSHGDEMEAVEDGGGNGHAH